MSADDFKTDVAQGDTHEIPTVRPVIAGTLHSGPNSFIELVFQKLTSPTVISIAVVVGAGWYFLRRAQDTVGGRRA